MKRACLEAFDQRVHILAKIADNETADDAVRIRALDVLARYAGLQSVEVHTEHPRILVDIEMPGTESAS